MTALEQAKQRVRVKNSVKTVEAAKFIDSIILRELNNIIKNFKRTAQINKEDLDDVKARLADKPRGISGSGARVLGDLLTQYFYVSDNLYVLSKKNDHTIVTRRLDTLYLELIESNVPTDMPESDYTGIYEGRRAIRQSQKDEQVVTPIDCVSFLYDSFFTTHTLDQELLQNCLSLCDNVPFVCNILTGCEQRSKNTETNDLQYNRIQSDLKDAIIYLKVFGELDVDNESVTKMSKKANKANRANKAKPSVEVVIKKGDSLTYRNGDNTYIGTVRLISESPDGKLETIYVANPFLTLDGEEPVEKLVGMSHQVAWGDVLSVARGTSVIYESPNYSQFVKSISNDAENVDVDAL